MSEDIDFPKEIAIALKKGIEQLKNLQMAYELKSVCEKYILEVEGGLK